MISADSIKSKLKIQAKSNSRTFQDMLVMYGLERTLYRVSISNYKEKLTLKSCKRYGMNIVAITGHRSIKGWNDFHVNQ